VFEINTPRYRFQILVSIATDRDDHVDSVTTTADEERPFPGFDAGDGILLSELPRISISVASTNVGEHTPLPLGSWRAEGLGSG
jgi:hypothetical protein